MFMPKRGGGGGARRAGIVMLHRTLSACRYAAAGMQYLHWTDRRKRNEALTKEAEFQC